MEIPAPAAIDDRPAGRLGGRRRAALLSVIAGLLGALGAVAPVVGLVIGPVAVALGARATRRRGTAPPSVVLGAAGLMLGAWALAVSGLSLATDRSAEPLSARAVATFTSTGLYFDPDDSEDPSSLPVARSASDDGDRTGVLLSVLSPFVGLAGGLAGAWWSRRERRTSERASDRKEAATVLVPVQSLLDDADPRRIVLAPDGGTAAMDDLWRRWTERVRDPLLVLANAHASQRVSDDAARLATLVSASLASTATLIRQASPQPDELEAAAAAHADATELARRLLRTIRRRSTSLF